MPGFKDTKLTLYTERKGIIYAVITTEGTEKKRWEEIGEKKAEGRKERKDVYSECESARSRGVKNLKRHALSIAHGFTAGSSVSPLVVRP